jgi:hypothetical protein
MIAGVSAKTETLKMQTMSSVFRLVTWRSLMVGYISFGTACSYHPQGSSLTNEDGTESLFRKLGDKITPRNISEKPEPPLQSSETLKSRIPNTSMEQQITSVFLLTYTGSEMAKLLRTCALIFYINFVEILSRGNGNFEEQNKILDLSIIIINYCIIINVYYDYIVQLYCIIYV